MLRRGGAHDACRLSIGIQPKKEPQNGSNMIKPAEKTWQTPLFKRISSSSPCSHRPRQRPTRLAKSAPCPGWASGGTRAPRSSPGAPCDPSAPPYDASHGAPPDGRCGSESWRCSSRTSGASKGESCRGAVRWAGCRLQTPPEQGDVSQISADFHTIFITFR